MRQCDDDDFIHSHDLIINMAIQRDNSFMERDIKEFVSCGAALLTYKCSFNIKGDKRGYLLKDSSKEYENEDRPNHEVEKPQVEDEEIWILSQLHASFQNAEYMKNLAARNVRKPLKSTMETGF